MSHTPGDHLAFPSVYDGNLATGSGGMTMREWYAGNAPRLPDDVLRLLYKKTDASKVFKSDDERLAYCLASFAFTYADAMLEIARET